MVSRIYVEKKPGFDIKAQNLAYEIKNTLGIARLENLRLVNRYDVEGVDEKLFQACIPTVFSEPQVDIVSQELPISPDEIVFAIEPLPGQFDQRADSASECIQLISQKSRPNVANAQVLVLKGDLSQDDIEAIKRYIINPIESREASLDTKRSLSIDQPNLAPIQFVKGFRELNKDGLVECIHEYSLAMDLADITYCQSYFIKENRDPTITELKVIDTYWSDHCRHTTFFTQLDNFEIDDEVIQKAFENYLSLRDKLERNNKPICLMDMATIATRYLKNQGKLYNLDESEEINACTIKIKVDDNGQLQDWLYLFKNETHNHPTEIEPFGGAATCIGGAIRDPLSGRSYVYQAMRLTGASDPMQDVKDTLKGKLPQRKIVTSAAEGYSSYGNQIGLATGQVNELYHPGYAAKRMEIGAVVGATPADHVRRETPIEGDIIVLVGGRTGRDGIGGATGSSKAHVQASLDTCGAEVQKGNALIERKIQRLFRRKDASRLIKRCNDFGAGGVSVAVGELADGIIINLNNIPKKYDGLNGTELAISESQERMAVVLAPKDVDTFIDYAKQENVEATPIALVTKQRRVCMMWNGKMIVNISRDFLDSNGAPKHQDVHVLQQKNIHYDTVWKTFSDKMTALVSDLNVASNKGLAERFDSTIGASSVLMPFGGKYQLTPSMAMVAKLPVQNETSTCSGMAWGFNPDISEKNQYVGAYLAVVESVSKLIATGFRRKNIYLSFQEYFERLENDPMRWGKPVASLLGALEAQLDLSVAAIGGKDSMSGSFEDIHVPPTLVSFATAIGNAENIISPEFKKSNHKLYVILPKYNTQVSSKPKKNSETISNAYKLIPQSESYTYCLDLLEKLINSKAIEAAATPGYGNLAESLFKMSVGNHIGIKFNTEFINDFSLQKLFKPLYGSFIVETANNFDLHYDPKKADVIYLGITTCDYIFSAESETIDLKTLQNIWEKRLGDVYPYLDNQKKNENISQLEPLSYSDTSKKRSSLPVTKPRVIIPVFPGSNCEFDVEKAFSRAGALTKTLIINTMSPQAITESIDALTKEIRNSQIIMIPGGFSGGDEPEGSAKFIASFFRSPSITEAIREFLQNQDGLMLGICNGFQALIKLGLVPYGDIIEMNESCPTLTFNTIGRHQSKIVRTRICSTLSPWLSKSSVGDIHSVAISHGEGRFVATQKLLSQLAENGQIATQYVDFQNKPSMDLAFNPNGSMWAIEGITSPDGHVFGKMGHTERIGKNLYKNIPNFEYQPLFESGVSYFKD